MTESSRWLALPALLMLVVLTGCDRFTSAETRYTRAQENLQTGEYQAALIDLRKILEAEPGNLDAQLLLVDVLAASGQAQAARVQLDRAVDAGASAQAVEARRLDLLLTLGDVETARGFLATTSSLSPSRRSTFEGRLLLLEQQPAAAEEMFENALMAEPGLTDAALGRIEAIAAQGRSAEASQGIEEILGRAPDSGRAWLLKGTLAMQQGEFVVAADALTNALDHRPGMTQGATIQAHFQRIESHLAAGNTEAASSALQAFEMASEGSALLPLMKAKVAYARRDLTTTIDELRRFTRTVPQHMPSRLLLAAALLEQGNTEQAFAEAVRNAAEFGDRDEPRLALAGVELRLGRVAEAEETLQALLNRSPSNPLAAAMLAELRIRRGESAGGVSLLEQAVAQQPDNQRLRLQLAAAQLATGEHRLALQNLERVQDPSMAAARDRLRVIATAALEGPASIERELQSAIARNPGDVDLLIMAATYETSSGQTERAQERLQIALESRPNDATLGLMLARLELAAGRVAEAEALTRTALNNAPNDTAAMSLMAGIALQRGQEAEVDAWLNRAKLANPGALDISLALARRALARGNAAEARSILAEAVRNAPADAAARVALAELIASEGGHAEALAQLDEAAGKNPTSALIPLAIGRIQIAAGNTAAARHSLRQALKLNPGWLPAAAVLANLEANSGNLAAALEVARQVRAADPQGSSSYLLEGDSYLAAGRATDAANVFATAYRRTPGITLAIRSAQAKLQAKAPSPEAELQDWVKRTPADAMARRTLAERYMATGQTTDAIKELEQVVALRPNDALALNNLAWLYQQTNDTRAVATAEQAYATMPRLAAIADTYGWILVQNGRIDVAVKVLSEAATLAPSDAEIQFHYAHALAEAGQSTQASEILRRLVNSGQEFSSLAEAKALLTRLGGT